MFGRISRFACAASCALSLASPTARADDAPLVHPIYAHLPDAPENDSARQLFTAAATRYNLRPVEVVDVPAPPAPHAPDDVRMGILNTQKLAFSEAVHDLDAAAAEVATTGGAGLTAAELADLYLFRAMAIGAGRLERAAGRRAHRGADQGFRRLPARGDADADPDAERTRAAAPGGDRLQAGAGDRSQATARDPRRQGAGRRAGRARRRTADADRRRPRHPRRQLWRAPDSRRADRVRRPGGRSSRSGSRRWRSTSPRARR